MNGRKRKVQIKFYVTEEDRALIEQKMKLVPTRNMAAGYKYGTPYRASGHITAILKQRHRVPVSYTHLRRQEGGGCRRSRGRQPGGWHDSPP